MRALFRPASPASLQVICWHRAVRILEQCYIQFLFYIYYKLLLTVHVCDEGVKHDEDDEVVRPLCVCLHQHTDEQLLPWKHTTLQHNLGSEVRKHNKDTTCAEMCCEEQIIFIIILVEQFRKHVRGWLVFSSRFDAEELSQTHISVS